MFPQMTLVLDLVSQDFFKIIKLPFVFKVVLKVTLFSLNEWLSECALYLHGGFYLFTSWSLFGGGL